MGPVFLFVFYHLNIDHYLTSSSSIDSKFHAPHSYVVEIGKKLSINSIKVVVKKKKEKKIGIFEKGV